MHDDLRQWRLADSCLCTMSPQKDLGVVLVTSTLQSSLDENIPKLCCSCRQNPKPDTIRFQWHVSRYPSCASTSSNETLTVQTQKGSQQEKIYPSQGMVTGPKVPVGRGIGMRYVPMSWHTACLSRSARCPCHSTVHKEDIYQNQPGEEDDAVAQVVD